MISKGPLEKPYEILIANQPYTLVGSLDPQPHREPTIHDTICKYLLNVNWTKHQIHNSTIQSYCFLLFICLVIFSVIWFSIYLVLWIRSTAPARLSCQKTHNFNFLDGTYFFLHLICPFGPVTFLTPSTADCSAPNVKH